MFSIYGTNCEKWYEKGSGYVFLIDSNLADILGDMDLDSEKYYFSIFGSQNSRLPYFQIPESQNFHLAGGRLGDRSVGRSGGRYGGLTASNSHGCPLAVCLTGQHSQKLKYPRTLACLSFLGKMQLKWPWGKLFCPVLVSYTVESHGTVSTQISIIS